ncbi:tRNA threonylcarbamoyladenosine biosynthesis protein TsaE [bacterium HR11]|nr:tRNA threonylcarbamoyladenosine biosynthesis protein TsaE [bacterium HR11]
MRPEPQVWESDAPETTERLAAELAGRLEGSENLLLVGELGSGKTTFVRGLVRGLGGDPALVASPTFVIVHVYAARFPVYHIDLYRLQGLADIQQAGVLDLLEEPGVKAIEWAERLDGYPVPSAVLIRLEVLGPTARRIVVEWKR